ncbi:MAG: hypothetical protein FWH49_07500, partial [Clostridiales bacterium]|nr:hypothetical protein [Clostridiales bacterium]
MGLGVFTDWSGSKDFYIGDNEFIGRENHDYLTGWFGSMWTSGPAPISDLASYCSIKLYGQGHVICYNIADFFHDAIDIATYGLPDGAYEDENGQYNENGYDANGIKRDRLCSSIDIYNNSINVSCDNSIESDGGCYNIRIMRNSCFNCAERSMSMQPVWGGPVYWIRNLIYHAPSAGGIKFVADPMGGLWYNNTFATDVTCATSSNMHFRNNLILAERATARVWSVTQRTNYSSSDYNGFCLPTNQANPFQWITPPFDRMTDYDISGRTTRNYATLDALRQGTGQEMHSILVDWDIFINAYAPDAATPTRIYWADDFDFQLKPDSVAVDAGMVLPNVTDGYIGSAPDLGAYEVGLGVPVYGPRW